jgi:rod shape-determining protein MreD
MTLNIRLFFALFLSFVLTILPLPEMIMAFRPPWVLLFVLYIQFFLPNYFNITLLFLLGLCLDVLLSTVIGEHAFALVVTTWFAAGKARRFSFFAMIQQMLLVALFSCIYELIVYLIEAFVGYHNAPWIIVGPAVLSMFFWPWVRILLAHGPATVKRAY